MATSYEQAIDPALLTNSATSDRADDDLFADDQEGEAASTSQHQAQDDGDMGDLFGDEDADDQSNQEANRQYSAGPSASGSDADGLTAAERRKRKAMEYEEDEAVEEQQVVELSEAQAQLPNLPLPVSSDGNYWILRLPNFIKLESNPFDQDTYQGPGIDEDSTLNNREKSMGIKLEVENTIRWRWVKGPDGRMRKQSNSRIIRWSDGTMSLQLGKEIFDVSSNIDLPQSAASAPRTLSQQASQGSQEMASLHNISRNQGLTYLFAQHVKAELLQAEAPITGTLSLTPTGMQSETHRKLVKAVGQKHNKVTRLMMAPDPTKESEQERAEQLKAAKRASTAKRRRTGGGGGGDSAPRRRAPGGGRASTKRSRAEWSDEDMSDDEDFGRRYSKTAESSRKRPGAGEYEADEFLVEDDEDEAKAADDADSLEAAEEAIERLELHRNRKKDKKRKDSDEESEEDGDDMAVSDDEPEAAVRRAGGRKTKRLALDDSDEE
ncbi:hypothetical protein M407DRAFT_243726 [Tulasnella calospora MUT 4182]|uniref:Leo1-like protein n=1 Tax=Tulasnella calospora MUT 4182 TaxID=1051891 RepID=A0A0C3QIA9_9AGAM|nr:hypothetical protein M407DRAFT_243726 [Tulasnella calospora MUT 4182]